MRAIAAEPVLGRGQHAAEEIVADFRRGDVDDAGEQAGIGELLHRAAAGPRRVEDEAVVASPFSCSTISVTQVVVTPNMVSPIAGLPSCVSAGRAAMATMADAALARMTRLMRFSPAMSVIDGHHDDVRHADIEGHVAGGERRDHDLRQAERQLAHARTSRSTCRRHRRCR